MNELIIGLLGTLAHSFGDSLGCAIITLSMAVRIALLPLTVKLARRAKRNQEIMQKLQPEIDQLKRRFEKKPERLFPALRELYRKNDCKPFDIPTMLGSLVQLPVFGLLYASIRGSLSSTNAFLWIKNLASPDFVLTLVILSLTGLSAYLMPSASEQMKSTLVALQVVVTLFIVWKLAAGLGLYWASSGVVGLFQTIWLRYRQDPTLRKG